MRAPILEEDAPFLLPSCMAKGPVSRGRARPHATRRGALTSRPGLGSADSDLPGSDLRFLRSELRVRPVSAPLPPATRGVSWLRRAAPANQRCRPRPSFAPQPMNVPATGHRPRGGGGRQGGGRVRPPGAKEPGAWRRDREGRERGLGLGRRRLRTLVRPEGSLSDGGWKARL